MTACWWLPCDYDKEVESVPRVGEVGLLTNQTHGRDFDKHFNSEEDEDSMIERLQHSTASGDTRDVGARLKHAKSHTVEQYDTHTDSLKPRIINNVKEQLMT